MVVAGGKEAAKESCGEGAGEGRARARPRGLRQVPSTRRLLKNPRFFLSWRGGSVEISDLGNYVPRMN